MEGDDSKTACLLVIFPSQQTAISTALSDGQPAKSALEDWSTTITELLKRKSSQIILVEDSVLDSNGSPMTHLAQKLNTEFMPLVYQDTEVTGELHQEIARLAVAVFNHNPKLKAKLNKRSVCTEIEPLGFQQIDRIARRVDAVTLVNQGRHLELQQQAQHIQSRLDLMRATFQNKVHDVELATTDMLRLHNQVNNDLKRHKAEIKVLLAQIKAFKSSTSWRITAPLRRLFAAMRRRKFKK